MTSQVRRATAAALAALVALAVASALRAATFAGVEIPAPLPARPVVDTYWGVSVEDPYRFLEDTTDHEVQRWMRAQADATATLLSRIPGRGAYLARLQEIDAAAMSIWLTYRNTDAEISQGAVNTQFDEMHIVKFGALISF